MKALISPNESFTFVWISDWELVNNQWQPIYSQIDDCIRVAEVQPNNKIFDVAPPLQWVDCPDECEANEWYYKDEQVYIKQENTPKPD